MRISGSMCTVTSKNICCYLDLTKTVVFYTHTGRYRTVKLSFVCFFCLFETRYLPTLFAAPPRSWMFVISRLPQASLGSIPCLMAAGSSPLVTACSVTSRRPWSEDLLWGRCSWWQCFWHLKQGGCILQQCVTKLLKINLSKCFGSGWVTFRSPLWRAANGESPGQREVLSVSQRFSRPAIP